MFIKVSVGPGELWGGKGGTERLMSGYVAWVLYRIDPNHKVWL